MSASNYEIVVTMTQEDHESWKAYNIFKASQTTVTMTQEEHVAWKAYNKNKDVLTKNIAQRIITAQKSNIAEKSNIAQKSDIVQNAQVYQKPENMSLEELHNLRQQLTKMSTVVTHLELRLGCCDYLGMRQQNDLESFEAAYKRRLHPEEEDTPPVSREFSTAALLSQFKVLSARLDGVSKRAEKGVVPSCWHVLDLKQEKGLVHKNPPALKAFGKPIAMFNHAEIAKGYTFANFLEQFRNAPSHLTRDEIDKAISSACSSLIRRPLAAGMFQHASADDSLDKHLADLLDLWVKQPKTLRDVCDRSSVLDDLRKNKQNSKSTDTDSKVCQRCHPDLHHKKPKKPSSSDTRTTFWAHLQRARLQQARDKLTAADDEYTLV